MRYIAVVLLALLAACGSSGPELSVSDLPDGDAESGEALWTDLEVSGQACSACHSLDGSSGIGPTMQGYSEVAAQRVEGQDAAEYTYLSIVRPAQYIVDGYSNAMPGNYGDLLTNQQLADLIAFSLAQ